MPAIICSNCRKLISTEEPKCPHCGFSQQLQNAPLIRSPIFNDGGAAVKFIIGISVFLYIGSVLLRPEAALSMEAGIFGIGSPDAKALYLLGMTGGAPWACGFYWTLLTANFLHGSLLHIYFNMSWLRNLGLITVAFLGPARFTLIYMVTGAAGFLASNLFHNSPTVGASCSLFGLMGVLITFSRRRGGVQGYRLNRQIWAWVLIGLVFGFVVPEVNNTGHIGGFVAGLAMGYLLPAHEGKRESAWERLAALGLLALTLMGFCISVWRMWDMQFNQPLCF
jgi:rhomboid protease GluP